MVGSRTTELVNRTHRSGFTSRPRQARSRRLDPRQKQQHSQNNWRYFGRSHIPYRARSASAGEATAYREACGESVRWSFSSLKIYIKYRTHRFRRARQSLLMKTTPSAMHQDAILWSRAAEDGSMTTTSDGRAATGSDRARTSAITIRLARSVEQEAALRALDTWTVAEVVSVVEGACCLLFGVHLAFGQVRKCLELVMGRAGRKYDQPGSLD